MSETRALKRIIKNLDSISAKVDNFNDDVTVNEIKTCLAMLNDEWKDFQGLEISLSGKFADANLDNVNKIEMAYFEIKQNLYQLERNCETEMARGNTTVEDLMVNQSQFVHELTLLNKRDNDVRLPRVNIPPFSGNYSEFPSFKDLFEASIDKNENMSKVHKLQHLKCLLKGEAYALIKHLNVTDANYIQAWGKVKERYNKPKHVIYNLLKQFLDQPILQQSTAKGLRHLTDISDEIIRGLQVLGEQAEKRDIWLIYILVNKLDAESKEAWAYDSADDNFPSLEKFFKFLNKRCDALECIGSSQKPKPIIPRRVSSMVSQAAVVGVCPMCSGDHYIGKCNKFLELPKNERREIVANKKLCFNCLSSTHQAVVCRSKFSCRLCKRKHHVTLHTEQIPNSRCDNDSDPGTSNSVQQTSESNVYIAAIKSADVTANSFQAILPTAIVLIEDKFGELQRCRALLDSGSQSSFISENCAQRLQLRREKTNIKVTGLTSGNLTARGKSTVAIRSMYDHNKKAILEALIINHLPTQLPKAKICTENKNLIKNFDLADPLFDRPAPIDVLIGADKFFEILENNQKRYSSLILNKTIFGWVVSGQPQITTENTEVFTTFTQEEIKLESTLRKFWEMEDIPNAENLTPEELACEELFSNTHTRADDGRYVVKLPFKKGCGKLGESLQVATIRFRSLERKLMANSKLRDEYVKQMREYINLGHMIELSAHYQSDKIYYLPHRSVTKETSSTTKVRVVFDGSSKTSNGYSLNDHLMVGPTIQPTLWATLLRFRTNKVGLVADIEKMYRQVLVAEEHRDYQTILWREKPGDTLKSYQLTRVTFGLACSAFLAIRTMQQTAIDSKDEIFKAHVFNDFYVDDILTGTHDEKQAVELKDKLTSELAKGGFCLRKWKSNIAYLSDTSNEMSEICSDKTSTIKTLGLQWHLTNDSFTFKINPEKDGVVTKRKIISESSRLFDPLGFLSPSTILLKVLFQKLWLLKVDWDDKLPRELEEEYKRIRNQFISFEDINIPRFTNHRGEVQIHGFSDASETAYCAVIYSRTRHDDGSITTQLLTAKTKVAPIKKVSLPRLELCAAHLLSKLMSLVKQNLRLNAQYFAWTDSEIVLAWLSTYPMRWKTIVANRTSQILDSFPRHHWSHVKSKDNPADHGSRGVAPEKIINLNQWWRGPKWLADPEASWPINDQDLTLNKSDVDMEYNKAATTLPTITLHTECEKCEDSWLEKLFESKFRLQKTFRVIAYVIRFVNLIKGSKRITSQLTATEINTARLKCIIWVQQTIFAEEIRSIQRYKRVAKKSKLLSLAPFIDEDGILRVGGRLQHADCDFNSKHPIILPQKHIFTTRMIWDVHLSKLHAGPSLTSNYVRQNYWVINGRSRIRSVLKECVICTRYAARTTKQFMGSLPAERVAPTRPFENCGIDFAGPIYITARKGRGRAILTKGYICIFVCLSVKAIHIEGVTDLTSEALLAALKRLTARRGSPKKIYTDNGSNFIGAKRILEQSS